MYQTVVDEYTKATGAVVFARVDEDSSGQEGDLVALDCVAASDVVPLMGLTHAELRKRWKVSFGLEGVAGESIDLSRVRTGHVTTRGSVSWRGDSDNIRLDERWLRGVVPRSAFSQSESEGNLIVDSGFEEVTQTESNKLNAILAMDNWPRATAFSVKEKIMRLPSIGSAVVHDVGQGSANALCDGSGQAVLYFDTGRPAPRNAKTAPKNLELCYCTEPLVILSHWDTDHWKAADKEVPKFQKFDWIVPSQTIRPSHAKFASKILQQGGKIFVVKRSSRPQVFSSNDNNISIKYGLGKDINNSGLILEIKSGISKQILFFCADATYANCPDIPDSVDLLVASHHGADARIYGNAPKPRGADSSRLVYSFGPGNSHGHATQSAIDEHKKAKWDHTNWQFSSDSHVSARGNARATYTASDKKRQSLVFPLTATNAIEHFTNVHKCNVRV